MRKRTGSFLLTICLIVSLCVGFMLPVGAYNYSTGYPNTHTNTGNQRADIVAIARTQVGYAEANDGSTKYGAWWQKQVGNTGFDFVTADWCAMFINWCANQAGATDVYTHRSALCSYILTKYQAGQSGNKAYAFGSGYRPRPGDIIFVGSGNAVNHVGLVVDVTDSMIYTVEGNSNSAVRNVSYSLETGYRTGSSRRILHFGVPHYLNDTEGSFDNNTSVSPKPEQGETGTAVDPYTVTVTASGGLNIRTAPSASAVATASILNGTKVTIVAEAKDANGNLWGKLNTGGWISLKYTSAQAVETPGEITITEITPYQANVSCDVLIVRDAPGLSGRKAKTLEKGTEVTVSAKANADDLEWGRIGTNLWVATAYLKTSSAPVNPETPNTAVTYTVTGTNVNLRAGAGVTHKIVGKVTKGDTIVIVATNDGWGKLDNGKWISMDYVKQGTSGGTTGGTSGTTYTVTGTGVNLRSGAGTGYAIVGKATKGDQIVIVTTSGNWGKLDNGKWICMDFVKKGTSDTTGGTSGETSGTTYTVTGTSVNLRAGAGTSHAIVGKVTKGDQIVIVSTKNGWGKLDNGKWISMDFVKKGTSGSTTGTTYIVNASNVNLRAGAGTGNAIVGRVTTGDQIVIVATSGNWGKLDNGKWICMDFVQKATRSTDEEAIATITEDEEITSDAGVVSTEPTESVESTEEPTEAETAVYAAKENVNVRLSAEADGPVFDILPTGTKVVVVEVKDGWGKLENGGWICLEFFEKAE